MDSLPPEILRKIASSLLRKNRLSLGKALGNKKNVIFVYWATLDVHIHTFSYTDIIYSIRREFQFC